MAAEAPERSLSVDGGKIADWEYYDLLGVQGNASDAGQSYAQVTYALQLMSVNADLKKVLGFARVVGHGN